MINFKFQLINEVNTGLIFEFAVPDQNNSVNNSTSKYLTEDAFGFIEGIINKHIITYKHYGHWAETVLNKKEWLLIRPELLALQYKIDKAQNISEVENELFNFNFIQEECLDKVTNGFVRYKPNLSKMITDFISWIDMNIETHGSVRIIGI